MSKVLNGKKLIVVIAYATAFIDNEMAFFEDCYDVLLSENPKLKNQDLTIFLRVQADFSSGNAIYEIESGKIEEANDKTWESVSSHMKSIGINNLTDLKNTKELEVYTVSL
jgi:hypothetical protein